MNINRCRRFCSYVLLAFTLSSCETKQEQPKFSTDLSAFGEMIAMDVEVTGVAWEIFGTPEYTGGVPGPTDYLTLVAQAVPVSTLRARKAKESGAVWIAPESARPWLEPEFKHMLEKSKNSIIDISKYENCQAASGILKRTAKHVDGFLCKNDKRILIYLRIE